MILYDVSVVGRYYWLGWARAGIVRVAATGAQQMMAAGLEGFTLCASSAVEFQGYLDFARSEGEAWAPPPLLMPRRLPRALAALQGRVGARTQALTKAIGTDPMTQHIPQRLARRALTPVFDTIERHAKMAERPDLRRARLFHSPSDGFPHEVRALPRLPKIITVYDLIPYLFPEYGTPEQGRWQGGVLRSAERCGWACSISEATKADLCEHVKISPERVFVTPLAADPAIFYRCEDAARLQDVRQKYNIPPGPYLLSVCTLEPRKNLDHLVRCFAQAAREAEARDLSLVLVGGRGWMFEQIFAALDEASGDSALSQGLRGRIVLTGWVPDEDLAPLYSGARAFAYMSLYEGFGLPPLEAMQCGVPVITSSTSSLPEVVGDAGVLLDPRDVDGLCQAIGEVCLDSGRRQSMAKRSIQRAALFSWERFARETIRAYDAVMQGF